MDDAGWTNEAAIARWNTIDRELLASLDPDGGFAKRHLVNPVVLRLLGDVDQMRILDTGCGQGYLSRLLAGRGASVVGVEPAAALFGYAVEREEELRLGVRYVQADLVALSNLGRFDAVVASMVLGSIPDWRAAMRACVDALRPGGLFIVTLNHPCFEQAGPLLGHARAPDRRPLPQRLRDRRAARADFHRPLSAYLNELVSLGCRLVELVEPALPPDALRDHDAGPGAEAYLDLPNFLVIATRSGRAGRHPSAA